MAAATEAIDAAQAAQAATATSAAAASDSAEEAAASAQTAEKANASIAAQVETATAAAQGARVSEAAAQTAAIDAQASGQGARQYSKSAGEYAAAAEASASIAQTSEGRAAASETAAVQAVSEITASAIAAAKDSATAATASKTANEAAVAAQNSATSASTSAQSASESATNAAASAATATTAANTAANAATSSATSATSAAQSAANAAASETAAATSAQAASASAQAANTAATQAAAYKYDPNTYEGVDLTVQFAEEIKKYTDAWAWIKARIQAGNYTDLHVGDYIPFTTTNSVLLKAQIAGIDTYTTGGYPAIGHHIDFICDKEWLTAHAYNKVNFNNGTAAVPYPWLASDLYHYCNSLSGTVPNASVVGGGDGEAVDYTTDGIYYYLPDALKAVIIQKRTMLPKRYSASGLLLNDNGWGLENAGYLWLPTEWEVYGGAVWGNTGYGTGGIAVQYPLFAHNMKWVRYGSVARTQSWLLSACAGSTSNVAAINYAGAASYTGAPNTAFYVLVCFRVG
jgi:hypothetical protein